jgi:hypothetical protein
LALPIRLVSMVDRNASGGSSSKRDAGAREHHRWSSELARDALRDGGERGGVANVGGDRQAGALGLVENARERGAPPADQREPIPAPRERQSRLATDARSGAGDHGQRGASRFSRRVLPIGLGHRAKRSSARPSRFESATQRPALKEG